MEEDNVIDISDRRELMSKMVEEDGVQLIEMGSSGNNYCLTLSKRALMAIREGSSFPLELLMGERKIKVTVIRNTEFRKKLRLFQKINEQAKNAAEAQVEANESVGIGKSIGEKLDLE
jgi:hypothetical protein